VKLLLFSILILIPTFCHAWELDTFDHQDKQLYASVRIFQIVDGLTTMDLLKKDVKISNTWAWKYGTNNPSAKRLWAVKGAELIGAYYVGKLMPKKIRKGFYLLIDMTLIYCIKNNLDLGAGFSITF
jgi:hypothetical protein